jgi:CTP:molybdopterin cytidylyltransferase MocA
MPRTRTVIHVRSQHPSRRPAHSSAKAPWPQGETHVSANRRHHDTLVFRRCVVYPAAALSTNHEEIVPIILAAGSSKHLNFPKALARFGDKTALQLAVENCRAVGRAIVVLGCDSGKIREAIPDGVRVIFNRRWREGQQSSLRCALDHVPANSAFMIYPVDHPLVLKTTVQRLLHGFYRRRKAQAIVMPRYKNRLGHPIIVCAALRSEFFSANTAREIVYRDPGRNLVIPVQTSAIYQDFDTPGSYRDCVRQFLASR